MYCQSGPWGCKLSPWFQRLLQILPMEKRNENTHCRWFWGDRGLQSSTSFSSPSPIPCPVCCLTQDGITPAGVLTQPGPSWSLFSQHFSYHIKRSLRTWAWQCTCLLVLALQGPMYRKVWGRMWKALNPCVCCIRMMFLYSRSFRVSSYDLSFIKALPFQ